jgi:hypothetical protein
MKKLLLILAIIISSQFTFAGIGFVIGPKVGFNSSKLSMSLDTVSSQFKSGFSIGAFARIGKKVYLQPELYYSTNGGVFSSNLYNWKQTVKIGALNIPVLIGYSFINRIVNVRVMAGPMVSFVINKGITESGSLNGPLTNGDISNANWYIQAGGGVDVWKLTLDIRYQLGLNKIINYNSNNKQFNSSNNVWVVSLGFKFL